MTHGDLAEHAAAIVDLLPMGVVVWRLCDPADDASFRLVGANRAASRLLARDLDACVGKLMQEVLPGVAPNRRLLYADVVRSGESQPIHEIGYIDSALGQSLFSGKASPLPGGCLLVAFEDIAAARRAEADQHRLGEFLDAIIENIPSMIFVKEAKELRFERINRAGEALIGMPREALLGKNDFDFFPAEQAEFFQSRDRETLANKTLVDIPEEPIATASGERVLHTRKVPLLSEAGVPRYLLGISEDITEQKRAEREIKALVASLEQRSRELEESNAELDGFSYSVSHDLRAPLRAIDGFARLLLEEHGAALGEEGQRVTNVIRRNAKTMGLLIDDLLRFSRLGRQEVDFLPVDVDRMVASAVEEVAALEGPGRALVFRVASPLPPAVGDAALLKQVWLNLLGNAAKYTRARAEAVIEVSGTRSEDEVIYSVADNGAGFDPKYAAKLFGVFQRLHSPSEYEGTGVGLALAHRIVRRHGGWIRAKGETDRGATFSFGLPLHHHAAEIEEKGR